MANRHHERRMLRNVVFFLPLLFVVVWLESEFLFSNQKLMIEYIFMSVGGAFGCALWLASIAKHKSIARIKYQNIHSIETKLSISLYSDEYQSLEANWKNKFLNIGELLTPLLMLAFFAV